MPRPKSATPRVDKKLTLSSDVVARVELELFSDLEGRVPYGAWATFVEGLIMQHFAAAKRREELATALARCKQHYGGDQEACHLQADELLVEELEALGYDLSTFKELEKWYA